MKEKIVNRGVARSGRPATAGGPPGATFSGTLRYGYNQRNLMITSTLFVTGTNDWLDQAAFDYDGANNRLRQVDYTGATTTTITYTNDILGLSQVLIADDGTEQVANLFGLDLIHQDDGTKTRTLLADGLGSVRLEMTSDGVETTTTYSPYGDTLAQNGTSGTVYGFTGEEEDSGTGLLYLRARYYNFGLRTFMGRDPWSGNIQKPGTLHGWRYAANNPINYVDPTGMLEDAGGRGGGGGLTEDEAMVVFAATVATVAANNPTYRERIVEAAGELVDDVLGLCEAFVNSITEPVTLPEPEPEPEPDDWHPPPPIPTIPPSMELLTVYRGLDGRKTGDIYKRPVYSPSQFRVDADGVSTFELNNLPGNKPYAIGFEFLFIPPKVPGITAPIILLPECMATYTPQFGPGHWSINCTGGSLNTKQILSEFAKNKGGTLNPNWMGSETRELP